MSKPNSKSGSKLSILASLLGVGLLAYLIFRTGPLTIWNQVRAVGWGLAIIIALGGISHLLKTWAWRLTFTCDLKGVSWSRSFGMRLVSEAIGQMGIAGKVLGEGMRVSLLGSAAPLSNGISSAAIDSGLYTLTSAFVTLSGIMAALMLAPVSSKWRFYALLFAVVLIALIILLAVAAARRWRLIGNTARAIGRLPRFEKWIASKQSVIDSAEETLLTFHEEAPRAFWASLTLNAMCHALAILEVYILLRFMGVKLPLFGAFALEGLTKLINLAGALNPGNVGTYEAGNILITKLFKVTPTSGLTLALCRRTRGMFWAAIGAACLLLMKRSTHENEPGPESTNEVPRLSGGSTQEVLMSATQQKTDSHTAVIFANCERHPESFFSSLANVGTLPVVLRTILTLDGMGFDRIIICVPSFATEHFRNILSKGGRLPSSIEWREVGPKTNLWSVVTDAAATSRNVMLLMGNRIYQPRLLQSASEWAGDSTLALATNGELAGVHVLTPTAAVENSDRSTMRTQNVPDSHTRKQAGSPVEVREVAAISWHNIVSPEDLPAAERKLNSWLIKPTDGLFAQMNRKVSIPISRQLIKFPITANMVTLFVLAVSFASGLLFARGGYWSTLAGAALSVAASILDGCDGEVARLKVQSTKFGCWLETVCDYLYYLFVFGGMAIGLTRSSGDRTYLTWGGFLCFGAIMTFLVVSFTRQRLSGAQPEKLLSVWQKKADARPSNPLLQLGRQTDFIIRRCFFPYPLFFFAMFGMTKYAFIATALGANVAWLIALYSLITFSRKTRAPASVDNPAALSGQATA